MLKICFGDKFTRTPKSAIHDKRLSGKDLCVLNAICECSDNDTHVAHVSLATLCDLGRVSKKTLLASLTTLEECGYIQRERRVDKNGTNASNGYTVLFNTPLPVEEIVDRHTYDTVKEVMDNNGMSLDDDVVIDYSGTKNDIEVKEESTTETPAQKETPKTTPKTTPKKAPTPKAKTLLANQRKSTSAPKKTPAPKLIKRSAPKTTTTPKTMAHTPKRKLSNGGEDTGTKIGAKL